MRDDLNAFKSKFLVKGALNGPLRGLSFVVKDIFDVAGHITGCGNPDWEKSHKPALKDATAVKILLDAGASLLGKTHTDELAYSLMGVNAHYGTPLNSADPRRVPGGSSSGSAAAVAAGLADIGLGSDTGGSVRLPASFCGLWGLRTTFGALSLQGAMPFTQDFDTVGWFTKTSDMMLATAKSFGLRKGTNITTLLVPVDIWAKADPATVDALAPLLAKINSTSLTVRLIVLSDESLAVWRETFRIIQAAQIWETHSNWVKSTVPNFGPGIADRFKIASEINRDELDASKTRRETIVGRLRNLLPKNAALVIPTSPSPAPFIDANDVEMNDFRMRAFEMLCPAGLAGFPQLSIPAGSVENGPVGLSFVGHKNQDIAVIELAAKIQLNHM
jgi:amidase